MGLGDEWEGLRQCVIVCVLWKREFVFVERGKGNGSVHAWSISCRLRECVHIYTYIHDVAVAS